MDQAVLNAQIWLNNTYKGEAGYTEIPEDGITGQTTVKALITALQIEIGISSPNGTFGPATTSACPTFEKDIIALPDNKVKILQHGLYCKGYSTKLVTGVFGNNTEAAVKEVQNDAGLEDNGIVTPLIFKTILNTDPLVLATDGDSQIRYIQQQLNKKYNNYFGIIPTNGKYERNTNKALIYALQAEEGMAVGSANGNFGPSTQSKCPILQINSTKVNFVKILQYALKCNGIAINNLTGDFNLGIQNNIIQFQQFAALPLNEGKADLNVWMSLLSSKGNTNRAATGCDCATIISEENISILTSNNYSSIGRYLTGRYKLTPKEINVLSKNNIRIFPIFQRSGEGISATNVSYFTLARARADANDAYNAAHRLGFIAGTIIYFAVDFDAYDYQVTNTLIPFFKELSDTFNAINTANYKIGIYGPRNVCSRIGALGYTVSSFVSDMSTGYSGNLGYVLPINWAIDQILTITIDDDTTGKSIEIDKDIIRGTYAGEIITHISYEDALNTAINITSTFEGGFSAIAGNFDGTGISLGGIQFNIGSGTLQPLLSDILTQNRPLVVSIFGEEKTRSIENMLSLTSIDAQVQWAISIHDGNNIESTWKNAFVALCETEEFIEIQMYYIKEDYATQALEDFNRFNFSTLRAYSLMFDIAVQCGGIGLNDELPLIESQISETDSDIRKMTIISNVVAENSSSSWIETVRSRKLCITNGTGTVNQTNWDLNLQFGLNDFTIVF